MTIKEILTKKNLVLSFELFPLKKEQSFAGVFEAAEKLSSLKPDFISVTCGAGGTTDGNTCEVAAKINSMGIPSLAHLTCADNTRESLLQKIQIMKDLGINNVLALRGDKKTALSDFEHASDIVPYLKQAGFCTGGACYPEGHPESPNLDADIDKLHYKVDAGLDFLTTQMFFDNALFYNYMYKLREAGVSVPVTAGIMPVTRANQMARIIKLSQAFVPRRYVAILDRYGDKPEALKQAAIAYATDQIIDLLANGIEHIHIYTMNKADVAEKIMANLSDIIPSCADKGR